MTILEADKILSPVTDIGLLYQYTSLNALMNMLVKEEEDEPFLKLRVCNAIHMNDTSECITGGLSYLKALENDDYSVARNIITFEELALIKKSTKDIQKHYFISSFSRQVDCLPMWHMYGSLAGGICLGFDSTIFINNGFPLYKCLYDISQIEAIAKTLCEFRKNADWYNIPDNDIRLYNSLHHRLTGLAKDQHFEYEDEYRLFLFFEYFIKDNLASFENGKYKFKVHFEPHQDSLISYIEIKLPIETVKEIWIGPTNNINNAYSDLYLWLCSLCLDNKIKINNSTAPYR